MAFQWDKIKIQTDYGELKNGIAPVIISASRATDIPAFYSKWFMNRLEKGYIKWENRFNPSKPQYVSFYQTRLIVFWSKNPSPLISYLPELDRRNLNYYFQYTLNDYEKELLEPNLPPLQKRIDTFLHLSDTIGKEKVIWRFDPVILTPTLSSSELMERVKKIGDQLITKCDKLVISFVDINNYTKVKSNFASIELNHLQKIEIANQLKELLSLWKQKNPNFQIATCAEDIDLEQYSISHNKCIDEELIIQLFSHDQQLMDFIGYPDNRKNLKDKNQRALCGCMFSKDIGSYNSCPHHCVYCYANQSRSVVEENLKRIDPDSETLLSIHQKKS